jgi:hypothetical protein
MLKRKTARRTTIWLCVGLTIVNPILTGCQRTIEVAKVPEIESAIPAPAETVNKPQTPLEELDKLVERLKGLVPSPRLKVEPDAGALENAGETDSKSESTAVLETEAAVEPQPAPEPVLIDSWPFFLEQFQMRTKTEERPNGMTWHEFQQLAKVAEKPVPEIKADMAPLPTVVEVAEIVSLLNEIKVEQNTHQHLDKEQQQLLADALGKADALHKELATAPIKMNEDFNAIEAMNKSLCTTIGAAIAEVDVFRTRKATSEEMTKVCNQLMSPTGTVGTAVTILAQAAPSIQAKVNTISTLATNLVTKARELRKSLEKLEKKVDDPRIQQAKTKSLSLEERLEKAASSWEVGVAALINPWLAIAVILFRLFSGGNGNGNGGNSSGNSGETKGNSEEEKGSDAGKGTADQKESNGGANEDKGTQNGGMKAEKSDDNGDPYAIPSDSKAVAVKTIDGDHKMQLIRRNEELTLIVWINGESNRRSELGFNFKDYEPQETYGKVRNALECGTLTIEGLTPVDSSANYPIDMQLSVGEAQPIRCRYKSQGADPVLLGGVVPSPIPKIEGEAPIEPIPFATSATDGEFNCRIEPIKDGYRIVIWRGTNDHLILPLLFGLKDDKDQFEAAVMHRDIVLNSIGVTERTQLLREMTSITLNWTLNEKDATYRFQPDATGSESEKWVMTVD